MTSEADVVIRPADIDLDFAPARSAPTIEHLVDDDLLLLDPDSGSTHVLNATGRVLWSGLDGHTSFRELTEDLADAAGAPVEDLVEPVLGWARTLGMNGLLDGVAPSEADVLGVGTAAAEGEPLPAIMGERLHDRSAVRLPLVGARPAVLVHWSFNCGYCLGMVDALHEARPLLAAQGWDVELVVADARVEVGPAAREHGLDDIVVLTEPSEPSKPSDTEADPFHDLGTPVAYVVDAHGVVVESLAFGADEVRATLRRLAGLMPLAVDHPAADGLPDTDEGEDRSPLYLALPPSAGVCAPSGSKPARMWTDIDTFLIGDLVVGIRAASASARLLVRHLLADSAYEVELRQPNYSVVLPGMDDPASRELNLLLWGDTVVVRSRSPRRIVDALLAHLSTHVSGESPDVWRIAALPVVRDRHAVLLPDELRSSLPQVQPRLARAGLSLVDLPAALVDTSTTELVVPPPTIPHHEAVADSLGAVRVQGTELPPALPGRYRLAGWVFPDPGADVGLAGASLAMAVAAVARPKEAVLVADVSRLVGDLTVHFASDLRAVVESASRTATTGDAM